MSSYNYSQTITVDSEESLSTLNPTLRLSNNSLNQLCLDDPAPEDSGYGGSSNVSDQVGLLDFGSASIAASTATIKEELEEEDEGFSAGAGAGAGAGATPETMKTTTATTTIVKNEARPAITDKQTNMELKEEEEEEEQTQTRHGAGSDSLFPSVRPGRFHDPTPARTKPEPMDQTAPSAATPLRTSDRPSQPKFEKKAEINIFVRDLDGRTHTILIAPDAYVSAVKDKIAHSSRIHQNEYWLEYAGLSLDNARTLPSYGIRNESNLNMRGRLRGGRL